MFYIEKPKNVNVQVKCGPIWVTVACQKLLPSFWYITSAQQFKKNHGKYKIIKELNAVVCVLWAEKYEIQPKIRILHVEIYLHGWSYFSPSSPKVFLEQCSNYDSDFNIRVVERSYIETLFALGGYYHVLSKITDCGGEGERWKMERSDR